MPSSAAILLATRLRARDARERDCFRRLITEHSLLQTRNEQLEKRLILAQHGGGAGGAEGTGAAEALRSELTECKQQVARLQAELLEKYKNQAQIATTAVSASNESEKLRDRLAIAELELAQRKTRLEDAEQNCDRLKEQHEQQAEQLKLYRDELQRLRQERVDTEKKMGALSRDNRMLIARMLEDKQQLSEELNRMNILYERLRAQTGGVGGRSAGPTAANAKSLKQSASKTVGSGRAPQLPQQSSMPTPRNQVKTTDGRSVAQSTLPSEAKVWARAHEAKISALCFGPDGGRSFASASDDGTIKLWDISKLASGPDCALVHASGSSAPFTCVDWTGNYVMGGSTDRVATIFDVRTQRESRRLKAHVGKILCCAFVGQSPKEALTGSADASIKLWDTRQGYPTRTIGCSSVCNCLDVAPGGMICCSGHLDGVVRVWDLRTGRSLHEIRGGSFSSMVSTRFSRGVVTNSAVVAPVFADCV